jgi:hypothetical protein
MIEDRERTDGIKQQMTGQRRGQAGLYCTRLRNDGTPQNHEDRLYYTARTKRLDKIAKDHMDRQIKQGQKDRDRQDQHVRQNQTIS